MNNKEQRNQERMLTMKNKNAPLIKGTKSGVIITIPKPTPRNASKVHLGKANKPTPKNFVGGLKKDGSPIGKEPKAETKKSAKVKTAPKQTETLNDESLSVLKVIV